MVSTCDPSVGGNYRTATKKTNKLFSSVDHEASGALWKKNIINVWAHRRSVDEPTLWPHQPCYPCVYRRRRILCRTRDLLDLGRRVLVAGCICTGWAFQVFFSFLFSLALPPFPIAFSELTYIELSIPAFCGCAPAAYRTPAFASLRFYRKATIVTFWDDWYTQTSLCCWKGPTM